MTWKLNIDLFESDGCWTSHCIWWYYCNSGCSKTEWYILYCYVWLARSRKGISDHNVVYPTLGSLIWYEKSMRFATSVKFIHYTSSGHWLFYHTETIVYFTCSLTRMILSTLGLWLITFSWNWPWIMDSLGDKFDLCQCPHQVSTRQTVRAQSLLCGCS